MKQIPIFKIHESDFNISCTERVRTETRKLAMDSRSLIVDLSAVKYVDSVALTLLHELNELCAARGGKLVAAGVHPGVISMFNMMGLEIILCVSVDAAKEKIASAD